MAINLTDRPITRGERLRVAATCVFAGVVALLTMSCGAGWDSAYPVTRGESRDSVYKILVDVSTQAAGADSTVEPSVEHERWSGTAWVVGRDNTRSLLMTAGHVCETRAQIDEDGLFGPTGRKLTVTDVTYVLIAPDGTKIAGLTVLEDDDKHDLCVLSVQGDLGDPIPVASADPAYGERGWYVGAPHGLWGNGIAGIYEATYSGRGAPFRGECDADSEVKPLCDAEALVFTTSEGAPGASGSPIIVNGYVEAVLNLGPRNFGTFTLGVPWDQMSPILRRVRHETE